MNWDEYARLAKEVADWGADYHRSLRDRPVRAQTRRGDISARIEQSPPERHHSISDILKDFDEIIMPGMTHWQHPRFFAYFPANSSPASALAEMIANTIASQCMLWRPQAGPAMARPLLHSLLPKHIVFAIHQF